MITTLDIIDEVFQILDASPLKNSISGSIYQLRRPAGSKKEDVVINTLPVSEGSVQHCVVNVNIHVPDIKTASSNFQPDTRRLKVIAKMAIDTLEEYYGNDYVLYVESQSLFEEADLNEHFVNVRLRFAKHQTEY